MGLNNGSDMIATISELSLNDVILILNKIDRNTGALHETRIDMADTTERINTYPVSHLQLLRADIDVSWILRKITKHSDTVKCKVEKTAAFLHVLQSNGFIVTPICDPDHRHSSKRDSFRRRADSIKKDIKIRAARFKLLSISEKIKSATLNGEDTSLLEVEKKEVRKTAKLENNFNEIPPNFPYQLHNHFQKNDMYDDNGILGSITAVQTGMYQADLAIARRHNSHVNESDVIFGNDGDFAMYVGREMIQIRNFIFDAKKGEIKSIALGFASNKLAALAKDVLEEFKTKSKFVTELAATTNSSKTGKCKKNVHEASNSATTVQNKDQQISLDLFAQYDDLEIRALIGFGCGCDVYKGGVPGLGPTTLARHISNMSETERTHIKNTLKSLYAERLKTDILTIEAFIQAIVYEPAHVLNVEKLSEECENEFQYVGDAPTLLTKYCKDFCSYDEDIRLCSEQWRHKYVDRRIIMWDDTNIPFQYKPTLAHEQRLTFSQYYNQNCGKAAVFLQRNGWVGTSESVWTGGITDSSVMISKDQDEREALDHAADEPHSILGRQLNFQRNDLVDGEVKPFHNILDKGYRISQEAARNHQFIIQPNFTNATQRFKGEEVLCIAEVASDRSANERGVRVVKRSAYITDGVETNASFERMEKVAKAFSFRCNFMFKPVL